MECPLSQALVAEGYEFKSYPPPPGEIDVYEEKNDKGETQRIEIGNYKKVKGTGQLDLCPECKRILKNITDQPVKIAGIG
jgi:hypothetical protein